MPRMLPPSDRAALDRLTGRLDYPMLVVTAEAGEERAGCLVGFATQCSIQPVRFLLCLSRRNHTFRVASRAGTLVAHVLGPADRALAALFGEKTGDATDKFARCGWRPGPGRSVLVACRQWFAGRVLDRFDVGDHVAFLVEPFAVAAEPLDGQLGFQDVRGLRPVTRPDRHGVAASRARTAASRSAAWRTGRASWTRSTRAPWRPRLCRRPVAGSTAARSCQGPARDRPGHGRIRSRPTPRSRPAGPGPRPRRRPRRRRPAPGPPPEGASRMWVATTVAPA